MRGATVTERPRVSVVVPALNEEANIAAAVESARLALAGRVSDFELLLVNDGSTDKTGEIMEQLAAADAHLRVVHHDTPRNLGGAYKRAIELAKFEYLFLVPGDNEVPAEALIPVVEAIGRADLIVPYTMNQHERPLRRRLGSHGFTFVMNRLFGLSLKYFNGTVVHRTETLRGLQITTDSFAYQAEILVKVLRSGASVHEVGIRIAMQPPERQSSALSKKNLMAVGRCIATLAWDVHGPKAWGKP